MSKILISMLSLFALVAVANATSLEKRLTEKSVVVFGPSYHLQRTNKADMSYNEVNLGIGLSVNNYKRDNEFYTTYGVAVLNDSYKNPFYFSTLGKEYRWSNGISLGANFLIGAKYKPNFVKHDSTYYTQEGGSYGFIAGLLPEIKWHGKDYSLNLVFSPEVNAFGIYSPALLNASFSYKF